MKMLARVVLLASAACLCGGAAQAGPGEAAVRRLTGEAAQLRGRYGAVLAGGLRKRPDSLTVRERDLLSRWAQAPGVVSVAYFDREGKVRWAEDPESIGLSFDAYRKQSGLRLEAAAQVMESTQVLVRQVPDTPVFEAAIPILDNGSVAGLLDLWIRHDGIFGIVTAPDAPEAARPPETVHGRVIWRVDPKLGAEEDAPRARPNPLLGGASEDDKRKAQQHYLAGIINYDKGDYLRAKQEWEAARRLDPDNPDVTVALSRVRKILDDEAQMFGGASGQGASAFDRGPAREDDRRMGQQHYLSGVIYYQKGDYAKARDEWKLALSYDPANVDAAAGLSRVDQLVPPDDAKHCASLVQAGRMDDAATACAACLEREPGSAACATALKLIQGRVP